EASHCTITDNTFRGLEVKESRAGNGIHLWYSRYITVRRNEIVGHRDGIYFEFVEDSIVEENLSEGNMRYGLHFMFSDRCRYAHNTFRGNGAGVAVMYTKHVEMTNNVFEDNWGPAAFGLLLKDITDSKIASNAFVENTVGIYAEGSNRVEIKENRFVRNGWAVKIMADAYENLFTRNNFVGNSFDVGTNSRQSFSTFEGNYWDAYEGYDLDRDGVGDVPFRPVRLFSLIVERHEPALLLMRSLFVQLLDLAERVAPTLTPETLVDAYPLMRPLSL
ncbi:MAG: nitrous oxide reductase family maturation protein NosD, partial [Acidiferrobacterales bacterium]|nr:nitrous oxide reductase family maturation protein NosD [Acidiferrobacterales bacterium]